MIRYNQILINSTRSVLVEKCCKIKPGCWLIRVWSANISSEDIQGVEINGEIDFAQFDSPLNDKEFKYRYFYRIHQYDKIDNLTKEGGNDNKCSYVDEFERLVFDFRVASKSEIKICKKLISID